MKNIPALDRRRAAMLFGDDTGAATAEYAITTMAAVAFAGLLVVIMRALQTRFPTSF
ncbi:DUF4244 domain-containing protein [Microbacterium oxydans]|uniref:DUF4244 domain-containing protein n=1 Tax=Microbacterium oxydans TaxID=82380 RepID=UPI00363CE66D